MRLSAGTLGLLIQACDDISALRVFMKMQARKKYRARVRSGLILLF